MKSPRRGDGNGGGPDGDPSSGRGRPVSGTLIVALMLGVTIVLWAGFTWLASSRFEGLHVVTFRSDFPGEVRVLALPFGDAAAWQVAFLERHPAAAELSRDEWIAARLDASWLPGGFFSGRSLQRLADRAGCTYALQLRGGPGGEVSQVLVHVPFASSRETALSVDAAGDLHLTEGSLALPAFLASGSVPAGEWTGRREGALAPVPAADEPLLPDLEALVFAEDGAD